jgi:Polyketide cyclase / dehydrase and lipid transport
VKLYGKSRSTAASQARVWSVWSDPNNWNRWNTGIRWCMLAGPLVSGATATVETMVGSKHTVTFSDVEPPARFTLSMGGPPLTTVRFLCEVRPDGSGSTISQSVSFSGPLSFLFRPLLGTQLARNFVPVLDGLAAAAEATESGVGGEGATARGRTGGG